MDKKTFEKEIAMCRKLSRENNGGCNWGKCENCGVIPLLYKLYKGKLLENAKEIQKIKDKIFEQKSRE